MENTKDRKFRMVLYPEDSTHCCAFGRLLEGGYNFAGILHNNDVWTADDESFNPEKHKVGEKKKIIGISS